MRLATAWTILLLSCAGTAMAAAIPDEIKKVVAFVYVKNAKGDFIPNGTAFFVGVPDPANPGRSFGNLVTAKHVLTTVEGGPWLDRVWLRLAMKSGGTYTAEIELHSDGPKKNVFVHTDPSVDIAVIPALPNEETIEFRMLSADLITSRADFPKLNISEGSEVFFTGLFTPHQGQNKNYPVVRFGRVAMLSDERIDWNGTPTDLYLIESWSFGGNSGSPVFFFLGSDRVPGSIILGPPELRLAGVMKGFFNDKQAIQVIPTGAVPVSVSNMGIAAVVPSYHIQEILFSDELRAVRAPKTAPN